MLTVGEFKVLLRRAHKRGTALDAELDGAMRRAARWIESNSTLQHMRRRFELKVDKGTDWVDLPMIGVKAILSMTYRSVLDDNGRRLNVSKVTQATMNYSPYAVPDQFFQDGPNTLIFNSTFTEDFVFDGMLARYTDWPKADNATHWLLDHAESLMLTQSMLELGLISRDERTYGMFMQHRGDQIQVLQNADFESQFAGADIQL